MPCHDTTNCIKSDNDNWSKHIQIKCISGYASDHAMQHHIASHTYHIICNHETVSNMSVSENWVPLKHIVAHRFRH